MTCSGFTGSDFVECILGNLIADQASSGRERSFNMFVDNTPVTIAPFQIQDLVCAQYGRVNANGSIDNGAGNFLAPCFSGRFLKDKRDKCHDCDKHKSKKHKSHKHKSHKHKSKKHKKH